MRTSVPHLRHPLRIVLVALALATPLASRPALAQNAGLSAETLAKAREHYMSGSRKYDLGKYDDAVEEFQAAYELTGDPAILYNIAKGYQFAKNPERALFFYKRYLARAESPPNKAEVQARINELTVVVERYQRNNNMAPTGIIKPEIPAGGNTGTARIEPKPEPRPVVKPENKPEPKPEPVVTPKPEPKPEPVSITKPEPKPQPVETGPDRRPLYRILGYTFAGVAVAGLVVGGAMTGLASSANTDYVNQANSGTRTYDSDLAKLANRGHAYDNASIAGYVVGGVAAVGAAVTLYLGFKPRRTSTQATILPYGSRDGAGIAVQGSF